MKRKTRRFGFRAFLAFTLVSAIYLSLTTTTSIVRGPSMLDTLHDGDRVVVSKAFWLVGPIGRDSIIVAKSVKDPKELVIKRVKYLPGDEVPLQYLPRNVRIDEAPYHVPSDTYYLLGDNRSVSEDSREYGPVPAENILGKVLYPILR